MNSTILAIDLGKFNSVLCWYDPAARAEPFPGRPAAEAAVTNRFGVSGASSRSGLFKTHNGAGRAPLRFVVRGGEVGLGGRRLAGRIVRVQRAVDRRVDRRV